MNQSTPHIMRVFVTSWLTGWLCAMVLTASLLALWNTSSLTGMGFVVSIWKYLDGLTPAEKLSVGTIYFVGWLGVLFLSIKGLHVGFTRLFSAIIGVLGSVMLTEMTALVVTPAEWRLWLLCGLVGGLVYAVGIRNVS